MQNRNLYDKLWIQFVPPNKKPAESEKRGMALALRPHDA